MSRLDTTVRVFIVEGRLTITAIKYPCAKDAFRAVQKYPVLQVEVEGEGMMLPEEFMTYCADRGLKN
ncbi:hypothetical protein [Phyllobacterium zundukense]|jgi:hypothetical protein|uniref:Uncharacterized protein n=1 Tax=Phyllobacterium zundukense TaxID=1867719 RepID=A0ACD4D7Z1_9HYPH|nr:hypothetical protein [Phyllobacterium zundukense]UXN61810.1 hypothetical protein N8E88_17370 [Phyllobacterium zundukense]